MVMAVLGLALAAVAFARSPCPDDCSLNGQVCPPPHDGQAHQFYETRQWGRWAAWQEGRVGGVGNSSAAAARSA
eukprot:COSAG04_NODE_794_length_10264_cov_35.102804_5_plen_74_part_00